MFVEITGAQDPDSGPSGDPVPVVRLDATRACVRGLAITELALFRGVLDAPLNEAFDVDPAVGFESTWPTWLANAVGTTDVVIVIDELRADLGALAAEGLELPGAVVLRDVESAGDAGCAATRPAPAAAVDSPVEIAEELQRVDAVPEGASIPDLLGGTFDGAPTGALVPGRREPDENGGVGGVGEDLPHGDEDGGPDVP